MQQLKAQTWRIAVVVSMLSSMALVVQAGARWVPLTARRRRLGAGVDRRL